jgi:hypothetical protein
MKQIIFSLLTFFITSAAWSQDLVCQISSNMEVVVNSTVHSVLNEKTSIGKTTGIVAYIIEKENHLFSVEAFLPDYEARIYGQGVIAQDSDVLTASFWGRDSLFDISCRLVK